MLYGTKVIVIDSNVHRKSGPRRGSLGFVFSGSHLFFSEDKKHVLCSMDIVFFRYGFEKKIRCELKTVNVVLGPSKVIPGQLPRNTINSMVTASKDHPKDRDAVVLAPLSEKNGCLSGEELKAFLICCFNVPENNVVLASIVGKDITPGKNILKIRHLIEDNRLLVSLLFNKMLIKQIEIIDSFMRANFARLHDMVTFFTRLRSLQILAGLVYTNTEKTPIEVELALKGKSIYNSNK